MALAETPHEGGRSFLFKSRVFKREALVELKNSFKRKVPHQVSSAQLPRTQVEEIAPLTSRSESFHRFFKAQAGYFQDRPIIMLNNANIPSVLQLLSWEVDECAEPMVDGKIDKFEASDYRQQELSDVIIFALSVLQQYSLPEKDIEEYLFSQMESYTNQRLPVSLRYQKDQPWSQAQESFFQQGLEQLRQMQRLVDQLKETNKSVPSLARMNTLQKDDIWKLMCRVMEHSWMLLNMCVESPSLALMEKTARNMAKYPVVLKTFNQATLSYDFPQDLPYKQYRALSRKEWGETLGNQYFYDLPLSPPEDESLAKPVPEKLGPVLLTFPSIPSTAVVMLR